jgi:pilus assembly protein CpaF
MFISSEQYGRELTPEQKADIISNAADNMGDTDFEERMDMAILEPRCRSEIHASMSRMKIEARQGEIEEIVDLLVGQIGGLVFLLPLFRRSDINEIAINPDGSLWVMEKGSSHFKRIEEKLDPKDTARAVEAILLPFGRAINEATVEVSARLPKIETLPALRAGARLHVMHESIVGRQKFPSVNIRLYEQVPVMPEKLVAWGVAPETVIRKLVEAVSREYRIFVIGGTGSGKTTTLAALCNGIPKTSRVVTIEDPSEIWIDHPHVVPIEAKKSPHGSTVPDYTLTDGVVSAMRMSPHYLVVGECRTGPALMALFNAMMSDHPGLSTYHADSPETAVRRAVNQAGQDLGIQASFTKDAIAMAIDLIVQVGWGRKTGQRGIVGIWEVNYALKGGNVAFETLYEMGQDDMKTPTRRG